jgi:hypothetical protein
MGVGGADEHAPSLAREVLIVLIAAAAGQQAQVFQPTDRLPDSELHGLGSFEDVVHDEPLVWPVGQSMTGSRRAVYGDSA